MLAHESQFNRFQSGRYWNSFTFGTYGTARTLNSRPRSTGSHVGGGSADDDRLREYWMTSEQASKGKKAMSTPDR